MMRLRVSCSVPIDKASPTLTEHITWLGLKPIVTPILVRAVYEGKDVLVGETLIYRFRQEAEASITVDYESTQEKREARQAAKRACHMFPI